MKRLIKGIFVFALLLMCFAHISLTHAQQVPKREQYVYVLHLTPRMHEQSAWGEAESKIISEHFTRLAAAAEKGQVILAGRTNEPLPKTFGFVIFESENAEAAKSFMESDPAIVANIMTGSLHPYMVAIQRKP